MPVSPTYPGVYIEELPSPVRTIIGVSTGTTAFVGPAPRGPSEPTMITSWDEYSQVFGGLSSTSQMSYGVQQFFLNGGQIAIVLRLTGAAATAAQIALGQLTLNVTSKGTWGNSVRARVDTKGARLPTADEKSNGASIYNLTLHDTKTNRQEQYRNISTLPKSPQSLAKMLASSLLVTVDAANIPAGAPIVNGDPPPGVSPWTNDYSIAATGGVDDAPVATDYVPPASGSEGIYKLRQVDIFNILCVPDLPEPVAQLPYCLQLCEERRAMLIVDPPPDWELATARDNTINAPLVTGSTENAAIYFPWAQAPDPADPSVLRDFAPSGAVAGVWARTDVTRGVWKAAAGRDDGRLTGATSLKVALTDLQIGELNPLGVNCLRKLPLVGPVVWGARTMAGADYAASQWKYVPVRRLALFLEESLYRSTNWVIFEPNDEPLWSQIRLNVGVFMHTLFRHGAFQGQKPADAYLVRCDRETNPQEDIDRGIVNIVVGFAPLNPAEFLIIQIKQLSPLASA